MSASAGIGFFFMTLAVVLALYSEAILMMVAVYLDRRTRQQPSKPEAKNE